METQYTTSEPAVLAHPKGLFEPRRYKNPKTGKEQGEPKYSAVLVFPKEGTEWASMRKHAFAVARAEWPGVKWADLTTPFKDGTLEADKRVTENERLKANGQKPKPDAEYLRGKGFLRASSQRAVDLSADVGGRIVEFKEDTARTANRDKFYFGVEALTQLNFVASEVDGKKYVTAYLNMVMSTGRGKKLTSGRSAADVFKSYRGSVSSEDPTGDASPDDEEIPY